AAARGPDQRNELTGFHMQGHRLHRLGVAAPRGETDADVAPFDAALCGHVRGVPHHAPPLPVAACHGITILAVMRMPPLHSRPSTPMVFMPSAISSYEVSEYASQVK